MKRIAILGCENSHANTFLGFIRDDEKYKDVEVVGVYSHDETASLKLKETFGVPVLSSYDEAVGKVDGVIVTARHGDNHYKYAKPYIESGIPMFIDKPITIDEGEAISFMQECQASGVRVTGGSSVVHNDWVQTLKSERENNVDGETLGGFVRCPISLKSPNGGFFFYAEHLVGVMSEIFGYYPKSVKAFLNEKKLTVVFRYENYDVTGLFADENYSCYYAMRVSEHHVNGNEFPIKGDSPCFKIEFDEFYQLLCGGEQKKSYKDFIAPVFVMNAVNRSLADNCEVAVRRYEV